MLKMTRKRFIKSLMSDGIPRNKAVKIAREFNINGCTYAQARITLYVPTLYALAREDSNWKKTY